MTPNDKWKDIKDIETNVYFCFILQNLLHVHVSNENEFIFQRDGCPKIVNLGSAKTDLFYERKKYGFKKRWELMIN
jgi:hypothetical protein